MRSAAWLSALFTAALLIGCTPVKDPQQEIIEARVQALPADRAEQTVQLPHAWNPAGWAGQYRYRMRFDAPPQALESGWGLYLPRAGNRFHVAVNGHAVARFGDLGDVAVDHAQQPHYVYLPPNTLQAGVNELTLDVAGEKARFAGVSRLVLGPPDAVRAQYELRDTLQTKGSFAVIAASLLFALAGAPLAWKLRDKALVLFCLACVFCALRTSYAVVDTPPLPYAWWSLVTDAAYAAYLLCLAAFCALVTRLPVQPLRALMWMLAAISVVAIPWYALERVIAARQYWLLSMVAFSILLCTLVIWHWYVARTRESIVLALAGAGAVAMAVHDYALVFYTRNGFSSFALARYSLMLFLGAMGWLLLERRRQQEAALADVRVRMLAELAGHRLRLEQRFDEQQAGADLTVQKRERTRILGDIHDGMGLQLQALLAQVELGELRRDDLAHEVRTAIEQMRMLVGNAEQFEGDLLMLFGQIRHQVERRLKHSGIHTQWQCTLEPGAYALDGARSIALQRLVFELTTNVIRHAGAKSLSVRITPDASCAGGLMLTFSDDGVGFDPAAVVYGNGLRSLARRVADLGADAHYVRGLPQGCCYVLHLPAANAPQHTSTSSPT